MRFVIRAEVDDEHRAFVSDLWRMGLDNVQLEDRLVILLRCASHVTVSEEGAPIATKGLKVL